VKLLLLNPNTTVALTERMHEAGSSVAAPGTVITSVTASRGLPYLSSRAEAVIGGAIALEILAECAGSYDAAVIAAFGDPALAAARELFPVPIIGMAEAAMLTACQLGGRFVVVTFATALVPWYGDCVETSGLAHRCAGIRALEGAFGAVAAVQEEKRDLLIALADRAVTETDADVLILAGAPLAGLADAAREHFRVPAIDPISAAVKQAEALAALRPRKGDGGSFRRPAAKSSMGLAPSLADWISHRTEK
jgi:allantoin racemase